MAIDLLKEYLLEYSGNIMIFSGFSLLVAGLMLLDTYGSLLSATTFFFGIVFVCFGAFSRLGLFYLKLRSFDGLGTILVCVSVVFFALSIALLEFLAVNGVFVVSQSIRGFLQGYILITTTYRPYAWLSAYSIWACIVSLVTGLILKVYCARR